MKTVVILQSNYIPWKGYFDLINSADLFIFHDDLQYTKGDWRNRNRIKMPEAVRWVSIPVGTSENRLICEVDISDHTWKGKHRRLLTEAYRGTPHFKENQDLLNYIYDNEITNLSDFNQRSIIFLARRLGIKTEFRDSRQFRITGTKTERVINLLKSVGADAYLSGPSGKNYLDQQAFQAANLELNWFSYANYPTYPQLHGKFTHEVSILDLIFHTGVEAHRYMKSFKLLP